MESEGAVEPRCFRLCKCESEEAERGRFDSRLSLRMVGMQGKYKMSFTGVLSRSRWLIELAGSIRMQPTMLPLQQEGEKMRVVVMGDGEQVEHGQEEQVQRYHRHQIQAHQCGSIVVKRINAPLQLVWSIVRRFDEPQRYKRFIQSCSVDGDGSVGSVRDVNVVSGLPATKSTERLEILNEDEHIMAYRIVGGDHRLKNYSSVSTLHSEEIDGRTWTTAIESYVVDVPEGNTKEDTCSFVETLIKCNLKSLADMSEQLAIQNDAELLSLKQ